jgi:hypothetical protein
LLATIGALVVFGLMMLQRLSVMSQSNTTVGTWSAAALWRWGRRAAVSRPATIACSKALVGVRTVGVTLLLLVIVISLIRVPPLRIGPIRQPPNWPNSR